MNVRDYLRDLLGHARAPASQGRTVAAARRTARWAAAATRQQQQGRDAFEERLADLAQQQQSDGKPIVAGRLRMIALTRIKAQLGERWPRFADMAHTRTRRVLDRRLADEDVYMQAGADAYMVLFTGLSGEEAAFKAQAIAREITADLLGDLPEIKDLPVQVAVHEIGTKDLAGGAPNLDALVAACDARERAGGSGGARAESEDDGADPPPVAAAEPVLSTGATPSGGESQSLEFTYLPVWSRRGRAVVLYSCVPVWPERGEVSGLRDVRGDGAEFGVPAHELDGSALRAVLGALAAMQRQGRAALVVAPVHWGTLAQLRTRREYLALCQSVPPEYRRQLGFSVVGIPPGAWRMSLADNLAPLQPFARFLAAHVAPHPSQVWKFAGTGVQAFTFDADGLDSREAVQYRLVESFIRQAHARQLAAGALWVASPASARALLTLGVDFLAGDAVAPPVPAPGAAYRLPLAV